MSYTAVSLETWRSRHAPLCISSSKGSPQRCSVSESVAWLPPADCSLPTWLLQKKQPRHVIIVCWEHRWGCSSLTTYRPDQRSSHRLERACTTLCCTGCVKSTRCVHACNCAAFWPVLTACNRFADIAKLLRLKFSSAACGRPAATGRYVVFLVSN